MVNPIGFSIISNTHEREELPSKGEKGEVTFSLRPRRGRSWLPLSPLPARRRFPAAAVFLFATFSFGGGCFVYSEKERKARRE